MREKTKPLAIAIIELRLLEGINKSASESAENSVKWEMLKFYTILVEGFMIDLNTFLSLTNTA